MSNCPMSNCPVCCVNEFIGSPTREDLEEFIAHDSCLNGHHRIFLKKRAKNSSQIWQFLGGKFGVRLFSL